jgi:hypothetical protein
LHPIAPARPALVFVVAEDGAGKTALLSGVAADGIKAGKKVLYIYNEGDPKTDVAPLIKVAGGNPDSDLLVLLDSEVEHYVPLEGMLENAAVKPHLPGVDTLIVDALSGCEAETIKRNTIHQRVKQFKKLVREGVTVYIAVHPNRLRNVRRPSDLVPAGWGAKVQVIWMIEPTDHKGHHVLEMIRSRFDEKPWTRYPFWVSNMDGVKLAVIDVDKKNTGPTIAELLEGKNPKQLSGAMADAKAWLLDYLAKHGPRLAETEVFPDGKVRGHSEATLTRVKAITPEIGHTPQGKGPSKWFLKADERTQRTQQDKRDDRIRKLETLRDDPSAPPGEVAAARAALARMFEDESVESIESVSDERTQQSQPPEAAKPAEPGMVIFLAGNAAGHSEAALTKAKAISKGQIEHTPQDAGLSHWFLTPKPAQPTESVESVSTKGASKQTQQSQDSPPPAPPSSAAAEPECWYSPRELGLAFRKSLGVFDVDASAPGDESKRTIFARLYITASMNALSMSWGTPTNPTTVLLNPPFNTASDAARHRQPLKVWIPYALRQYTCGNVAKMVVVLWHDSSTDAHDMLLEAGACLLDLRRQRFGDTRTKGRRTFALYLLGYSEQEIQALSAALIDCGVVSGEVREIKYVTRATQAQQPDPTAA